LTLAGVNLGAVDGAVLGDGLAKAEVIELGERRVKLRLKIPPDVPAGLQQLHVSERPFPCHSW
jgi:hypothetical protein